MSLFLNQTKIPGYNQKISATLPLASEDMSGNSSATPKAETGDKSKIFSVSTQIRFIDADQLSLITNLAEARNSSNERLVYTIINNTAKAMNVRQVVFSGDMTVREDESIKSWTIVFSLAEFRSVPEKKEQRIEQKKITALSSSKTTITGEAVPQVQTEPEVELSYFEKIIKKVDNALASDETDAS